MMFYLKTSRHHTKFHIRLMLVAPNFAIIPRQSVQRRHPARTGANEINITVQTTNIII